MLQMDNEKEDIKLQFGINSLVVNRFYIEMKDELASMIISAQKREYTFEIKCENKGSIPHNLLFINVTVKVYLDKEKKLELGCIELLNTFQIPELKQYLLEEKNILDLPIPLEFALISISISHTRAMLYSKCAGTFLQDAMLPIVNPMDFIKGKQLVPEIQDSIF